LKLNFQNNTSQTAIGNDIYLLIELYERYLNVNPLNQKDQPVTFCSGKCGTKKQEVISLQEKKISCNEAGVFEAIIAINEQCAHSSDNRYGSPNTRFYFKLQLGEKITLEDGTIKMNGLVSADSPLIKVVAPGKSKQTTIKSSKKVVVATKPSPNKLTMKQMMETFFITIQTFEERLSQLEKKLDARSPTVKEEVKHEDLPDAIHFGDISCRGIKQPPQPPLRRSCEFSFEEENYLSLSQEINFLTDNSLALSP